LKFTRIIGLALLSALLAAACGGDSASKTPTAASTIASPAAKATTAPTVATLPAGKITVYAASSLTDAFKEEAIAFQAAHPGVSVEFNFAGSPTLRTQLEQGATADLLATADTANMQTAVDQKLVNDLGSQFVKNRLAIIVPKSNPGGVTGPADLAKPGLKLVLALSTVPVGKYAHDALTKMAADPSFGAGFDTKVLANLVSEEPNVKAIVTKIQLGEADAGIVYVTDVTPGIAADVKVIDIPDAYNVIASYPIAVTKGASQPKIAQAFIDYLLSAEGQATLKKYGFIPVT
jgi:molybdate transport system substrate-binding protein